MECNTEIKRVLTTHAAEQAIVGSWQCDVGMVVTIETHPQTKGCLQDNKLATQVNANATYGVDRWEEPCAINLKNRDKISRSSHAHLFSTMPHRPCVQKPK